MAAHPSQEVEALKRELAEVKKQLAVYQNAAPTRSHPSEGTLEPAACPLLHLPAKLRNAIYELCVVVGKVYFTHATTVTTYDMRITNVPLAELQLFSVCKQIHNEARDLFIQKNLFVLTSGPCTMLPALRKFVSSIDTKALRRLSISFDYRDYAAAGVLESVSRFLRRGLLEANTPLADVQETMSSYRQGQALRQIWYPLAVAIRNLRLDYLQISFQNYFDPTGSNGYSFHQLVVERENDGANGDNMLNNLLGKSPRVIDVIGTYDKSEREWFRECIPSEIELQFHGGKHSYLQAEREDWDETEEVVELVDDDAKQVEADDHDDSDDISKIVRASGASIQTSSRMRSIRPGQ